MVDQPELLVKLFVGQREAFRVAHLLPVVAPNLVNLAAKFTVLRLEHRVVVFAFWCCWRGLRRVLLDHRLQHSVNRTLFAAGEFAQFVEQILA